VRACRNVLSTKRKRGYTDEGACYILKTERGSGFSCTCWSLHSNSLILFSFSFFCLPLSFFLVAFLSLEALRIALFNFHSTNIQSKMEVPASSATHTVRDSETHLDGLEEKTCTSPKSSDEG